MTPSSRGHTAPQRRSPLAPAPRPADTHVGLVPRGAPRLRSTEQLAQLLAQHCLCGEIAASAPGAEQGAELRPATRPSRIPSHQPLPVALTPVEAAPRRRQQPHGLPLGLRRRHRFRLPTPAHVYFRQKPRPLRRPQKDILGPPQRAPPPRCDHLPWSTRGPRSRAKAFIESPLARTWPQQQAGDGREATVRFSTSLLLFSGLAHAWV